MTVYYLFKQGQKMNFEIFLVDFKRVFDIFQNLYYLLV